MTNTDPIYLPSSPALHSNQALKIVKNMKKQTDRHDKQREAAEEQRVAEEEQRKEKDDERNVKDEEQNGPHLPRDFPLMDPNFHPSRTFYILQHKTHSRNKKTMQKIPVFDITPYVDLDTFSSEQHDSKESWFKLARKVGHERESAKDKEICAVHRWYWYVTSLAIKKGLNDDSETLIDWRAGFRSNSKDRLIFPTGSELCSHEIAMRQVTHKGFRERFVVDGCPYEWIVHNSNQFRCHRLSTDGAKNVAWLSWKPKTTYQGQDGVLVVETMEGIHETVIVTTAMVIIRRMEQEAYEYMLENTALMSQGCSIM
jgi:hypothetical protein